jgi:2-oxoglutarate dehydrogenase E1 component
MHYLIKKGTQLGMEEFVIGMPHRGRLNILANIMQKPYEDIFRNSSPKLTMEAFHWAM